MSWTLKHILLTMEMHSSVPIWVLKDGNSVFNCLKCLAALWYQWASAILLLYLPRFAFCLCLVCDSYDSAHVISLQRRERDLGP